MRWVHLPYLTVAMPPQTLPLVLILCAPLEFALAVYVWSRRHKTLGARLLAGYMLGASLASLGYGLELLSASLPWKLAWVGLRYVGNTGLAAPIFLLLNLWFIGQETWLRPRRVWIFFILPAISLIGFFTNPWHHLHYATVGLDASGPLVMLVKTNGPLYPLTVVQGVGYLAAGEVLALWAMLAHPRPYLRLALGIFLGGLLPIGLTVAYLAGWQPWHSLNLTPFGYIGSSFIFLWAVFKHQLLEALPMTMNRLFDRLRTGMLVLDARHRVVSVNPAALAVLERPAAQLTGQPVAQACAHWPAFVRWFEADTAGGAPADPDEIRHWSAERFFALERTSLLSSGQTSGQIILLTDITRRHTAERTLRHQQRALAVLAEREKLARDLHDGVGQLTGFVSLQSQTARHYLAEGQVALADAALVRLHEAAREAQADVRNFILGLQGDEADGAPANIDFYADLPPYVTQFNEVYASAVRLSLPPATDCPALPQETALQLLRIVQEALNNSRKHAGAAAQTRVTVLTGAADLLVVVEDDGSGFDPAAAPVPGHLGRGIMAERAGQIGARLDIRSAPGQGTQVKVTLPLAPPPPEVSARLSHLRVLLVDDQELFRTGLRNLLAARGIQVVGEASSGRQALELAAKLRPDLVLMDLNMPEMNGLEATRTLREQNPAAQVVILTVNDQADTLAEALRAGAAGYLLKDLRARELFDLLEVLGRGGQPISPGLAGRALQTWAEQSNPVVPIDEAACPLTERQLEILRLAALELTSAQMAERLSLSEATIKYHLRQIFEHLQVSNREQALAAAARQGWIERRSR